MACRSSSIDKINKMLSNNNIVETTMTIRIKNVVKFMMYI